MIQINNFEDKVDLLKNKFKYKIKTFNQKYILKFH